MNQSCRNTLQIQIMFVMFDVLLGNQITEITRKKYLKRRTLTSKPS
jgi:hypothetical protein